MTPEEFWATLQAMPEPAPVFYRLYHNEDGTPICYTMEDLPGKYIEVDQETYSLADYSVRVVNKQLIKDKVYNLRFNMILPQPLLENNTDILKYFHILVIKIILD